jgi:hypothetical protein
VDPLESTDVTAELVKTLACQTMKFEILQVSLGHLAADLVKMEGKCALLHGFSAAPCCASRVDRLESILNELLLARWTPSATIEVATQCDGPRCDEVRPAECDGSPLVHSAKPECVNLDDLLMMPEQVPAEANTSLPTRVCSPPFFAKLEMLIDRLIDKSCLPQSPCHLTNDLHETHPVALCDPASFAQVPIAADASATLDCLADRLNRMELRLADLAEKPVAVCRFVGSPGGCRFGSICRFSHVDPLCNVDMPLDTGLGRPLGTVPALAGLVSPDDSAAPCSAARASLHMQYNKWNNFDDSDDGTDEDQLATDPRFDDLLNDFAGCKSDLCDYMLSLDADCNAQTLLTDASGPAVLDSGAPVFPSPCIAQPLLITDSRFDDPATCDAAILDPSAVCAAMRCTAEMMLLPLPSECAALNRSTMPDSYPAFYSKDSSSAAAPSCATCSSAEPVCFAASCPPDRR